MRGEEREGALVYWVMKEIYRLGEFGNLQVSKIYGYKTLL